MATKLSTVAYEESAYTITCVFTDEDGASVTPNSITWSLKKTDGTVINGRDQVSVETPAATVNITMSGDDLAMQSGETSREVVRLFLVEAEYDSSYGSDLPLKRSATFKLDNLISV